MLLTIPLNTYTVKMLNLHTHLLQSTNNISKFYLTSHMHAPSQIHVNKCAT